MTVTVTKIGISKNKSVLKRLNLSRHENKVVNKKGFVKKTVSPSHDGSQAKMRQIDLLSLWLGKSVLQHGPGKRKNVKSAQGVAQSHETMCSKNYHSDASKQIKCVTWNLSLIHI